MSAASKKKPASDTITTNRKARRDYQVLEKIEAGVQLLGTEVKSLRAGDVSLNESYAVIKRGQVWLHGCHINPYEHGNRENHDPLRPKRLLLHRREIDKLLGKTGEKGLSLIPLRIYLNRNLIKVELGLCRGKHSRDKREDLKKRSSEREVQRAITSATRRRS